MEPGFVPDRTYGAVLQTCWHPGSPDKKSFLGLRPIGAKVDRQNLLRVTAFRCRDCGLIRHYAV
jgi:hypothetical protein